MATRSRLRRASTARGTLSPVTRSPGDQRHRRLATVNNLNFIAQRLASVCMLHCIMCFKSACSYLRQTIHPIIPHSCALQVVFSVSCANMS
ncbi:hypothetical protein PLICRDRAFT_443074 [Plicaturopsis crispa FD-325 SS-3]|uniref:Uncharacterized protein n=1 Tax=Plicaturopsis crispa FD-325 SS-3 TaxID=944288 RepID=A0A0C9T6U5_PLICR|nr:hypothetical protein PLICRDRAFT_443074 [Plicaturopsis crispa FD-325 SS-3]